jgi:uncharacterized protein (DUF2252 family)
MKNVLLSPAGYGRSADILKQMDDWNSNISIKDKQNKYLKMAHSAFIFFRGTDHIFWSDFASDWRLDNFGNSNTRTWVQGDSHVENFGAFHNSKHEIVYGLNDFDEAVVADYQYDLWRMAISIVLVLNSNKKLSQKEREHIVDTFAKSYLETLCSYKDYKDKDVAKIYFTEHNTSGILKKFLKKAKKSNSYDKMLKKWLCTTKKHNEFNLKSPKLDEVTRYEYENVKGGMVYYGRTLCGDVTYSDDFFDLKDVARRLEAGTGSLGTSRYYILIEDKTKSSIDDHILDVKYQGKPTPYNYLSEAEQIDYDLNVENDAQRHAEGYKALAGDADNFLGWMKLSDGYYSVRERSPFKETLPSEDLKDEKSFLDMSKQWATVLATGHEQASRYLYNPLGKQIAKITKGRRKEFQAMVREIAFGYANQVDLDWNYFVKSLALTPADFKRQKDLL